MNERRPADAGASDALARAEDLDAAVRARSRWTVRYLVAVGVLAFALEVSSTATDLDRWFLWVPPAVIVAGIVVLNVFYRWRQPVFSRSFPRNQAVAFGGYMILHTAVFSIGNQWFTDDLAWWIPGAAVEALPFFVGAYLERRQHAGSRAAGKETQ